MKVCDLPTPLARAVYEELGTKASMQALVTNLNSFSIIILAL
jgi:hypothetical protein